MPAYWAAFLRLEGLLGLVSRIQDRREQLRCNVDHGNDAVIGHAGRPDDPQNAHNLIVDGVGRGDHAAIIENLITGFLADEYLHAAGLDTAIEQIEQIPFQIECIEQSSQFLNV